MYSHPRAKTHIVLFGPTSVGKGFTMAKIGERFPNIARIGMGEYFRNLRSSDHDFDRKYGEMMDRGQLIPGLVVCNHAAKLINDHSDRDTIVLDGTVRSALQVKTLNEFGLLKRGDVFINIVGAYETCLTRHQRRLERAQKDCGNGKSSARTDEGAFDIRHRLHITCTEHVLNGVRKYGLKIFHIDGNQDLQEVAEAIIGIIEKILLNAK